MKYKSSTHGEIEVSDMHPNHLRNAIAKLEAREQSTGNPLTPDEVSQLMAMREQANAQTYDPIDE